MTNDDYSNKFFFGFNGKNFESARNMDMGTFKIIESKVFSGETTVEKGCIAGLLYEFV